MSDAAEIRHADAGALILDIFRSAILPAARIDVADFAIEHRYLTNDGGGYVGRWSHDQVPYLVKPMRSLTNRLYDTVAVVGPGQSAKTTIAENWFLQMVANAPANLLWYMQTDDGVSAYVKGRINPMIEAHEALRSRQGLRPVDDSLHFKRFRGMTAEFLSATQSNLINKSAANIIADEIDAYAADLGDVKALLDIRRQVARRLGASMLLAISHPDLAEGLDPAKWLAGIMAIYAASDRQIWYWPCPECGAWSSPNPWGSRVMAIDYPAEGSLDEIEAEARLVCPVNRCRIANSQREEMNLAALNSPFGGWIGNGQALAEDGTVEGELVPSRTAGFWIVGAMSPFVLGGIGGLARARVKAERELAGAQSEGSETTLRTVMAKQWGVPWSPPRRVGATDAAVLADRAEPTLSLGQVPRDCRFLTLFADCQLAHFDWLARGWSVGGESWIVDKGRLSGDPATAPEDWDRLFAEVISRAWPLADGSGRAMGLRVAGYDSHGQPGVTTQAMEAWRRWRRQGKIRNYGRIAGRDAWSIVPTRGVGTPNAPRLSVTYPDTSRVANRKASRGDVPVAQFNANVFKDDLAGHLMRADPGPGYVHFPHALRSVDAPHLWFEQLAAEQKNKAGRWEKLNNAARNEALDQLVGTHVLAHLHGLPRIDWKNPPPWADAWERNPLVVAQIPAAALSIDSDGGAPGVAMPVPSVTVEPARRVRSVGVRL